MPTRSFALILLTVVGSPLVARADVPDEAAVQRGKKALETRAFNPAGWSLQAYGKAWKLWPDRKSAPEDYQQAFMERYGLHPAPYANGKYPMGLREGAGFFGGKGLASDCMLCHGSSILGKSYVGLGNSSLDIQALFEDMDKGSSRTGKLPITFSNVRGTSEAAGFAIYLLAHREPNLNLRLKAMDLDLRDDLCEDVPAWWLLKKKKTMYHTGATPAQSVRSIMQFMLASTHSRGVFEKEERTFADIQAYLLSLTPPSYPYPVDEPLAAKGEKIFRKTCSTCHGTYGNDWTYPNKIVPIVVIGTDPTRFNGISTKWGEYYNQTWFADKERVHEGKAYPVQATKGYQAPPLDGVWATAPYLHNGSVPTLYHLLNSKTRPKIFTRSFQTDAAAYDREKVGWKVQVLPHSADPMMPPYEQRKIYDTRRPGRGNGGHTFGDALSEPERLAVIEYLKTL